MARIDVCPPGIPRGPDGTCGMSAACPSDFRINLQRIGERVGRGEVSGDFIWPLVREQILSCSEPPTGGGRPTSPRPHPDAPLPPGSDPVPPPTDLPPTSPLPPINPDIPQVPLPPPVIPDPFDPVFPPTIPIPRIDIRLGRGGGRGPSRDLRRELVEGASVSGAQTRATDRPTRPLHPQRRSAHELVKRRTLAPF